VIDLRTLDRPPAGFGACADCANAATGSAPICFACASEHTEPVAAPGCETCGLPFQPDGSCGNPICNFDDRYFDRVWAISMRTGQMRTAIDRYKYGHKRGWAAIFGRILVGFLNERQDVFGPFHIITPSPAYVGTGALRPFDHIRQIVEAAEVEEPIAWPFTYGSNWKQRRGIAESELRQALRIADASAVAGKRVLVIDDVFTEGFTIPEVAREFTLAGAIEVSEVVLARQPWG
jgi:predicted amidophosphoribosyltransferase